MRVCSWDCFQLCLWHARILRSKVEQDRLEYERLLIVENWSLKFLSIKSITEAFATNHKQCQLVLANKCPLLQSRQCLFFRHENDPCCV